MKTVYKTQTSPRLPGGISGTQLLVGLAAAAGVVAGVSLMRGRKKAKRYGDSAVERRKPENMFAAGVFPRRRAIDMSGNRPLFERRQSAYEAMGVRADH